MAAPTAQSLKELGTQLYKQKHFKEALRKYLEALQLATRMIV